MAVAERKSPRKPRWKRRPAARPTEIASAALDVFARDGFESATVDRIASEAGVSKGTVYLYYRSKEDLFVACIENQIRENRARILPLLDLSSEHADGEITRENVRNVLEKILEGVIQVTTGRRSLAALKVVMTERHRFPRIHAMRLELINVAIDAVREVLRRAHRAGLVDCPSPRDSARLIISLILTLPVILDFLSEEEARQAISARSRGAIKDFTLRGLGLDEGGKRSR